MSMAKEKAHPIQGHASKGFEPVRDAFVENFAHRNELGAACCIYYQGDKVVDLWGGVRNKATGEPWEEDTMVGVFSTAKGMAGLALALAGLILWTYQRYVGIHTGSMAFVAESVDSRNHVVVALSVTAGLVAAMLHFGLLDMLVGLVVAVLILWSAVQLVIDLVKSSGREKVDLSRYGFWLLNIYEHFRDTHLKDRMLYLVDHGETRTKADLISCAHQAFDFRNNPWMKFVGLDRQFANETEIEQNLNELFSQGWIVDQEPLILTHGGKEYLQRQDKARWRRVTQMTSKKNNPPTRMQKE